MNQRTQKASTSGRGILLSGPLLLVLVLTGTAAQAFPALTCAKQLSTRYAEICYEDDRDLARFAGNIGGGFSFLRRDDSASAAKRVDQLVEQVMDLLGMHVPGLRFSLYPHRNRQDMDRWYVSLLQTGRTPVAFYDHAGRSIAVSIPDLDRHVLAHEIAHAVVCAWFSSPPPRRMQEILARYVDEHLEE